MTKWRSKIARDEEVKDRRVRRTRRALRLSLQDLLDRKSYENITIRDIADDSDIAYTTFFRHYPDKDSLLSDLFSVETGEMLDLILPMFAEGGSTPSVLAMCEYVKRNERIWTTFLTGGASDNFRAAFIREVEQRSDQWPGQSGWLPPDVGTPLLCGVTLDILGWWLSKAQCRDIREIAAILERFFRIVEVVPR